MDSLENDSSEWQQIANESLAEVSEHDASSSPPVTPKSERIPVALDFGSGSGSSDVTPNHDGSDSSYSELDSEAEAFYSSFNHNLVDSHESGEKQMSYGELMKKFVECEEELRIKSVKLQDSELEVEKLKSEAEKRDYAVLLAEDLRVELEVSRKSYGELMKRFVQCEEELRMKIVKLQDSELEIEKLKGEAEKREHAVEDLRVEIEVARKSYGEQTKRFVQCEEELRMKSVKLQDSELEIEKLKGEAEKREHLRVEIEVARKSYGELTKRFVQCEEELRMKSVKLQDSELEIEKLKSEAEKSKYAVADLGVELEFARREIEKRNKEIEAEKTRVHDLGTSLSESCLSIEKLTDELEETKEYVDVSDAQISKLRGMLNECQQRFSTEKTKLETDIAGLKAQVESHSDTLENQNHVSLLEEYRLQYQINALKTDLASRNEHIQALNKDFDEHKVRYDMLKAEKDEVSAQVDNLKAEMISREEQLNQMLYKQNELVYESRTTKKTVEELKGVVKELEKQAKLLRNVISEGEEKKREAIRQLSFSMDHYKTGYRELLLFLSSKNKQQQGSIVV